MSGKNIVVAGATGAVGIEILKVLEKRKFPVNNIRLLASKRSLGNKLTFRGEEIKVEELTKDSFKGMDIALFSAGGSRSLEYAPISAKNNCVVVDNSSAFRMDEKVPLVIPEINPEDIKNHQGIIANPNCSTIILLMGIYPIYQLTPIDRIIVSTYQAASGAGAQAMQELIDQSEAYLHHKTIEKNIFPHQIAFNLFSHNTPIDENGYNTEEIKMVKEVRKILHNPDIKVTATCVRVPVLRAHSESVSLELQNRLGLNQIREAINQFSGARVVDDREKNYFPMPIEASGLDDVLVGRIRYDECFNNGLAMFIAGDQLLKGAALNAVQIAEKLL